MITIILLLISVILFVLLLQKNKKVNSLRVRISKLEDTISNISKAKGEKRFCATWEYNERNELKKKVEEQQKEIQSLKLLIFQRDEEIDALKDNLLTWRASFTAKHNELKSCEFKCKKLEEENAELLTKYSSLQK